MLTVQVDVEIVHYHPQWQLHVRLHCHRLPSITSLDDIIHLRYSM
jgi:hypothetical protein